MEIDPEREICVTCGATEAMITAMIGSVDLGEEVIVFEPFYENYGADAFITGASPRYVTLREPYWSFDESELSAAFSNRTRAIVLNTPSNPTGKVFSREELTRMPGCATSTARSQSPTRSTSTSSTTAPGTSRWRPSLAWKTARSRSAPCPRPTL